MSSPTRQGKAVNLTLDFDAERLLRLLAPGKRGLGRVVSELLRAEAHRRIEQLKITKGLQPGALYVLPELEGVEG
jgi:hypothetical protein